MAKGKKTGGRKKGVSNKRTVQFAAHLRREGITPLDYMLQVLRDPTQEHTRRDDMAKAAAPYVHSKMPTAIVTPAPPSGPVTSDDQRLVDLYLTGLHAEADES